jgi:hypothetical protein
VSDNPESIPGVEQHSDGEQVRISDPAVFDTYVKACGWSGGTAEWEKDTGVAFEEVKGKWFCFSGGPSGRTSVMVNDNPDGEWD